MGPFLKSKKHKMPQKLVGLRNFVDLIIEELGEHEIKDSGEREITQNNYPTKTNRARTWAIGARSEINKLIINENSRIKD